MDHHGAKCTQIDEGMCQGVICTCQNFFSFTNLAVGVTFLKVILHLLKKVLNPQFYPLSPLLVFLFYASRSETNSRYSQISPTFSENSGREVSHGPILDIFFFEQISRNERFMAKVDF